MKKYKVNVNGNLYEVTVEEVSEQEEKENCLSGEKTTHASSSSSAAEGEKITSPMPGNILSVNISNGARVKKGEVLMVLEAMKMENEIMAPRDGVIASVNVSKGATVESGTLLCVIK